jgi:hypothetical protein
LFIIISLAQRAYRSFSGFIMVDPKYDPKYFYIKLSGQKITPFGFNVEGFPQHPPGEKTLLAQASACNY